MFRIDSSFFLSWSSLEWVVQGIFRYKTNIFKDHEANVLQIYEQNVMCNGSLFEGVVNVALYDNGCS